MSPTMAGRALKAIFLAAAILRLAPLMGAWNRPEGFFAPDSEGYVELRESLMETNSFERHGQAEIFRAPGYPLLLCAASVFGEPWWRVVCLFQIALDVALMYLVFLLGCMLCGRGVGVWAAAFQALSGVAIASSVRVLSDSVYALPATLSVLLLAHHFRTSRWWSLCGAAVVAAAGCYVRPVGLVLLTVGLVVLAGRCLHAASRRRGESLKRLAQVGAWAGISAAVLLPWCIRNHIRADYFGFSSVTDTNVFEYEAPGVLAKVEGVSVGEATARLNTRLEERLHGQAAPTLGDVARAKGAVGREVIAEHPGTWAHVHVRGSAAVFLPGITYALEALGITSGQRGTLDVLRRRGLLAAVRHYFADAQWAVWVVAPLVAVLAVKYLFICICAAARLRLRMGAGAWLVLLAIVCFTLAAGPASTPRFRVPAEPLLAVAAGAGVAILVERFARAKNAVTSETGG